MKSRTGDYEPMNPEAFMAGRTTKMGDFVFWNHAKVEMAKADCEPVTIARAAGGQARYPRVVAGPHGHVAVMIEPEKKGTGVFVLSEIVDGAVPPKLLAAVHEGILRGLKIGPMGGPVTDLMVSIVACRLQTKSSDTTPDAAISGTSSIPKLTRPAESEFTPAELFLAMAGTFAVWEALKKAGTVPIK